MGKIGKKMRVVRIHLENTKKNQRELIRLKNSLQIKAMYVLNSRLESIGKSINLRTDFLKSYKRKHREIKIIESQS